MSASFADILMQRKRISELDASRAMRLAAALSCTLTAACAGGAGSGSSGTTSPPTGGGAAAYGDTGITGTVAAPAAATFGSAAAQLAASGGPTFDGTSGSYPANVAFPLILTTLQKSSTGLSVVTGVQGATATVVSTAAHSATLQLAIPSLGLNETLTFNTNLVSHLGQLTDGLSYMVMGTWLQGHGTALQTVTPFVFGYETPQSAVPASGTAAFSGTATASIYKPVGAEVQGTYAEGNASLSVNFGSGSIAGSFTKMEVMDSSQMPWNDVSVSGTIAPGTNRFSGSTAAASSPAGPMSLSGAATGHIDGAFYGPAAQNLGAIWSLSDGTGSALGTVAAGH